LIPRPETELLARFVIDQLRGSRAKKVLDIGTGSGCLAITIALEVPNTNVHATDVSTEALSMARHNARKLQARVEFQTHDILSDPLTFGPLDIVVSNPPYVLESEQQDMEPNVKEFEPAVALFVPDTDPLLFYKIIAEKALASLVPNGVLITEINELFGQETKALFQTIGFKEVTILQDLEGKDRFVSGIR
jgi:release factor glutamine methyltransferase